MKFKNKKNIQFLKQKILEELSPLINRDYVLIDVPNHRNIGDNLIWKGELDFLSKLEYKCKYSANLSTFQAQKIPKNAIILLHGGGNFGDIYVDNQELRLKIIKQFPEHRIIIFPQTIYYKNEAILEQESAIFNKHKDLIICARDKTSYDRITKYFDPAKIKLLPDMAFCIDLTMFHDYKSKNNLLHMKRTDKELNNKFENSMINELISEGNENKKIDILDWPSYSMNQTKAKIISKIDALEYHLSGLMIKTPLLRNLVNDEFGLNSKSSMDKYIQQGINFLNSYDKIATTRLHGFILSVLLDKEVIFIDNSYGKNSTFFETWMKDFEKVSLLK